MYISPLALDSFNDPVVAAAAANDEADVDDDEWHRNELHFSIAELMFLVQISLALAVMFLKTEAAVVIVKSTQAKAVQVKREQRYLLNGTYKDSWQMLWYWQTHAHTNR